MEFKIDIKYKAVLLEALDDYQYKLALALSDLKGHALTKNRKQLTRKQKELEALKTLLTNHNE